MHVSISLLGGGGRGGSLCADKQLFWDGGAMAVSVLVCVCTCVHACACRYV